MCPFKIRPHTCLKQRVRSVGIGRRSQIDEWEESVLTLSLLSGVVDQLTRQVMSFTDTMFLETLHCRFTVEGSHTADRSQSVVRL